MPWIVRLIPNNDTSLYNMNCATCHKADRQRHDQRAVAPRRRRQRSSRDETRGHHPQGHRPHARLSRHGRGTSTRSLDFLITGNDKGADPDAAERAELAQVPHRRRDALPRSGRLSADHAALGHAECDRPQRRRRSAGRFRFGEFPGARGEGADEHRQRQLRRPGRHGERPRLHRRDELRQEVPRVRQADGQAAVGDDAAGRGQRDAVASTSLHGTEYVVIVCGGGKNGAPSGSSIVAFALPN